MSDEYEMTEQEIAEYEHQADESPPGWDGEAEPRPDMFEDYDQYVSATVDYRIKQVGRPRGTVDDVADAVAARLQSQPRGPTLEQQIQANAPDDELFGARQQAVDWIEDCKRKEAKAMLDGDLKTARDWKQRSRWGVQEIEKLGKSQAEQFREHVAEDIDEQSIKKALLNPAMAKEKIWDSPKMQHDSAIVVARSNMRAKTAIRLPAESGGEWGTPLPCVPKNMVEFDLPEKVAKDFQQQLRNSGADTGDHEKTFRESWKILRSMGYSGTAKRIIESASIDPDKAESPEQMSWKRYVQWREAQEEKKRGRKRQGFAFPKPIRRD